jgi:Xaa-Pro aminopeptidase
MNARLPETSSVTHRVTALREAMAREGLAAYVVPSADPHLSEYLPERWQTRRWLSGFTGSVGLLVVTAEFAGLWADSRYWVQAQAQLAGSGIELMKMQTAQQVSYIDWLGEHVSAGAVVGADGAVLAVAAARQLEAALNQRGVTLRTDLDLIDAIWAERSAMPTAAVYEHEAPYATVSRAYKLASMREAMREQGAQWHFVSTLDDIAWVFNLRGSDVSYNPVFCAHALIGQEQATLYVADGKVPAELAARLAEDGVALRPYETAGSALAELPAGDALLIDPRRVTAGLLRHAPQSVRLVEAINPSVLAKSRKTPGEAAFIRTAMEQDGAALAEFFTWFEAAQARGEFITELTIDEHLTAARARRPGYVSPSFGTIAGFNANGAMPHYHASPEAHARIEGDGLLLIDSGGQYLGGTTDITRVVPVGQPNQAQRRDFTLVLKSMMALSRTRFPRGIRTAMLDAVARAPMWAAGLDYGHGTGHGVGYFLNVHEAPQVLSYHAAADAVNLMHEGLITSIEPGVYRPGQWGIRIENLVLNRAAEVTEFGDFLEFETLTLCPIDTRCVLPELLSGEERDWLNAYHATVLERVGPLVSGEALAWLEMRTQAI